MDTKDQPEPDADPDAALRAAFTRMRGWYPKPHDMEAYELVRSKCPALSSTEKYKQNQSVMSFGSIVHVHAVIEADDIPAMHELIRIEPGLLTCECPGDFVCPPMVLAVRLGRHAILDILMKHRATLPPEMLVPPQYEDDEGGNWGTALTEACAMGRLDTVRLLLQGMPDIDINETGPNGFTPLLAAAESRSGPTCTRIALIQLLLEHGADRQAVQDIPLAYDETLESEFDADLADGPFIYRSRPGGNGNALVLAMSHPDTDPAVLTLLVEAGVNVFQSRPQIVGRIDETSDKNNSRYEHFDYDRAFVSPMAISAMNKNIVGIKTLLRLLPDDHFRLIATTDATLVPEPRPPLRDPDDDVPVLLPLHAALLAQSDHGYIPWTAENVTTTVNVVRLLTADEVIRTATIDTPYRRHYTPLHMATSFDRIPLLLALLELGADLEVPRRDGHGLILTLFSSVAHVSRKPLQFSTSWAVAVDTSTDMMAVLQTLLQRYHPRGRNLDVDFKNAATRRALVNEADANGNTPLHFTMAYRLPRSTAALVALGAQTNAKNHAGQVPYTLPLGQQPTF